MHFWLLMGGVIAGAGYGYIFVSVQIRVLAGESGKKAILFFGIRHLLLFSLLVLLVRYSAVEILFFFIGFVVAYFSILSIVAYRLPWKNEEK